MIGCVPNGPASDSKPETTSKPAATPKKITPAATQAPPPASPPLTEVFQDNFERKELGADWYALGSGWKIRDGKLCTKGQRNRGVWLNRTLPTNARIEFDALSESPEGDLKAELWGDGRSGATSVSYTNSTSYLTIFGGWKNTFHVLARIDEHAKDRLEVALSPDGAGDREKPISPNRTYAFKIERSDGATISWWVDGTLIHRLEDKQPLTGKGHDHMGFNNWEVPVCFDNLKVTPL